MRNLAEWDALRFPKLCTYTQLLLARDREAADGTCENALCYQNDEPFRSPFDSGARCNTARGNLGGNDFIATRRPWKAWLKIKNPKAPAATREVDGTF
jgi:hypothetical protein